MGESVPPLELWGGGGYSYKVEARSPTRAFLGPASATFGPNARSMPLKIIHRKIVLSHVWTLAFNANLYRDYWSQNSCLKDAIQLFTNCRG